MCTAPCSATTVEGMLALQQHVEQLHRTLLTLLCVAYQQHYIATVVACVDQINIVRT